MATAEWIVNFLSGYAVIGVLFAIAFVTAVISHLDPVAKGSGIGFRLIILPGVAALWPLLLARLLKGWIREGRRIV
jgi:hypothetical protein